MGEGTINQPKSVESMKEENMKVRKIAILFSGNGSNLESLIRCLHKKYFKRLGEFSLKDSQARGFLIGGIESEFVETDKEDKEAFGVEVVLALSNKANAYGLERAKNLGVKTQVLESAKFARREDFDRELVGILKQYSLDLCVLAGFFRVFSTLFLPLVEAVYIPPFLFALFLGVKGN